MLVTYLGDIADEYEIQTTDVIIKKIVSASVGSLGIALMILDKLIGMKQKDMSSAIEDVVCQYDESINLCRALMKGAGWNTVATILGGLRTTDAESIRRHVLGYTTSCILKSPKDLQYKISDCFSEPFYNTGFPGLVKACFEVVCID